VVDFNLAFFSSSENVTVKTLLKSVHIYQSYCKKNLVQFFWPTLYITQQSNLYTDQHNPATCLLTSDQLDLISNYQFFNIKSCRPPDHQLR